MPSRTATGRSHSARPGRPGEATRKAPAAMPSAAAISPAIGGRDAGAEAARRRTAGCTRTPAPRVTPTITPAYRVGRPPASPPRRSARTANDMLAQPNTSAAHGATPSRKRRLPALAGMSGAGSVPTLGSYGSAAFHAATSAIAPRIRCGTYGDRVGAGANSATTPATRPPRPKPPVRAIAARRAPVPGGASTVSSRTHALPAPNAAPEARPARKRPKYSHSESWGPRSIIAVATRDNTRTGRMRTRRPWRSDQRPATSSVGRSPTM